jgi:peroxiredoxin
MLRLHHLSRADLECEEPRPLAPMSSKSGARRRRGAGRAAAAISTLAIAAACGGEVPGRVGADVPAPEYAAPRLGGGTVSLADLRGEPVLLNIWATWCHPCREEMPDLQALSERYAPEGLRVLGVSIDQPGSEEAIRAFLGEVGVDFTILLDPRDLVSRRFQALGVPETYLIDPGGVIRKRWIGRFEPLAPETIEAVEAVLAREAGSPSGQGR